MLKTLYLILMLCAVHWYKIKYVQRIDNDSWFFFWIPNVPIDSLLLERLRPRPRFCTAENFRLCILKCFKHFRSTYTSSCYFCLLVTNLQYHFPWLLFIQRCVMHTKLDLHLSTMSVLCEFLRMRLIFNKTEPHQ